MAVSFEYNERRETLKLERDGINPTKKPTGTGCVECLKTDGW
jgi:hypothetical protein